MLMMRVRLLFDPHHANKGGNPIIGSLIRGCPNASTLLEEQMNKTSIILAASLAVLLSACGKEEAAVTEAPAPAPAAAEAPAPVAPMAEAPAPVAENLVGKKTYGNVCSMCHASGAAGAPKPGDKADWGPRIAQGMDMLHKHAIEGFTGAKGVMPARGGSATLSDDDVKAAVDYMV
ncbi:MAG: c-type cytochrome, partial [Thiobacillus sp.]|nr:c-type cytochrome [Thiobacillus sp.]